MPYLFWTTACIAGIFSFVLATPIYPLTNATSPATSCSPPTGHVRNCPPSEDPWYIPPSDWSTAERGAVLKYRLADDIENRSAWNIMFRTTDSNEQPTWAVTTLIKPWDPEGTSNLLLSYQYNYDSADVDESPSWGIYHYSLTTNAPIFGKITVNPCLWILNNYLNTGWWVNLPDYEGPTAAFGAGRMAGYATLDSIQASLSKIYDFGMAKPSPDDESTQTKVVMYGYSGGSIATMWAAELHPVYASKLVLAGAGAGGIFPDVLDTMTKLDNLYLADLYHGIGNMHCKARKVIQDILKNDTWETAVEFLSTHPRPDLMPTIPELLKDETVKELLRKDLSLNHGVPKIPMFIHRAAADGYSNIEDTKQLKRSYCLNGTAVYLHINENGSHLLEPLYSQSTVLYILRDMVQGTFPTLCFSTVQENIWYWDSRYGSYFAESAW